MHKALIVVVSMAVVELLSLHAGAATPATPQSQGVKAAASRPRTSESFSSPPRKRIDFTVEPVVGKGEPFNLASVQGKYVVLHFLLETSCPHCMQYTHEYMVAKSEPEVVHIFLKPDSQPETEKWAERYGKQWDDLPVIYSDPKSHLAKRFGIPFGYAFHGTVVHYPALVLLDPQGREAYRYVGRNNSDRCRVADLAGVMEKIRSAATQPAGSEEAHTAH